MKPPIVKITITADPDKGILVDGPLNVPLLCIKILTDAINIVINHSIEKNRKPQPSNILTPNGNGLVKPGVS